MNTLSQLSSTALLGTRRSQLELKHLPLDLPPLSTEAQLLAAAGTLHLYTEVGQLPQRLKQVKPSLKSNDVPVVSPVASRYLLMMLEGTFSDLLPEFFLIMQETQQRLPEEYLPNLLERAKNMYSSRELILPILGKTGLSLAQQNPAWAFVLPLSWESAKRDWGSSVMLIRQAIVKQARVTLPALGLDLIESTWKSESPTDRTWILKSLRTNLSMQDEPFLEMALDDRSHTVRKLAAELLSVLPESRLSRRIVEVAKNSFQITESLEYHAPEITSQLSRDGISQPNWTDPERVKASQIVDLIGLIHLDFWQHAPEDLIHAALTSTWSAAYLTGLAGAIERQQNLAWAKALVLQSNYHANVLKLVTLLETSNIDEIIPSLPPLEKSHSSFHPACRILSRWNRPWSEVMTVLWLTLLTQQVKEFAQEKPDSSLEVITKYVARFCPRTLINRVYHELQFVSASGFSKICLEPLLILEFRQKMLKSLGVNLE